MILWSNLGQIRTLFSKVQKTVSVSPGYAKSPIFAPILKASKRFFFTIRHLFSFFVFAFFFLYFHQFYFPSSFAAFGVDMLRRANRSTLFHLRARFPHSSLFFVFHPVFSHPTPLFGVFTKKAITLYLPYIRYFAVFGLQNLRYLHGIAAF